MLHCLYVSRATFLKWGVSSGTSRGWLPETCKEHSIFIQRVISLVPESKQQQNRGLFLCELRLFRSLVEGSRGIFELTSWGEKASSHPRKQIEQKVNIRGCISLTTRILHNDQQKPCYHQLCLHSKLSANPVTFATAPPLQRLWLFLSYK